MRPLLILLLISFNHSIFAQSKANEPYLVCTPEPQFPGGDSALMSFIRDNLKYPEFELENGIQGKVVVSFKILADGSLNNVEVVRQVNKEMDKEALRLVKLMHFMPANGGETPYPSSFVLPIEFKIATDAPNTKAKQSK